MPLILVLTANRKNDLQLADELRVIRAALGEHSNFTVVHEAEVRVQDLISRLLREQPEIVHFAGHGLDASEPGLSLAGSKGQETVLTNRDLRRIFKNIPVKPRLVILNACFSAEISKELKQQVEVVIGTKGEIEDEMSLRFAESLYSKLANSCSVGVAVELVRTELRAEGFDPDQIVMDNVPVNDPAKIVFYARPEIMAKFALTRTGKPQLKNRHYSIHLWLRGIDQYVECVSYEINHDSFRPKDRYWEVTRSENASFLTDDFRTTGDVTLRATAWAKNWGIGVQSTLHAALRRFYGENPEDVIAHAIEAIHER